MYSMNDVVFDLDNKFITNRPDLFSVVGNAREIACIEKTDFVFNVPVPKRAENTLDVRVESTAVYKYILREFSVKNLPESPFILQLLLKRSGQGSHGILADLTNLVMTEVGQPMHVFDADLVSGSIVLRMAKK